jgi:hypothetical protein
MKAILSALLVCLLGSGYNQRVTATKFMGQAKWQNTKTKPLSLAMQPSIHIPFSLTRLVLPWKPSKPYDESVHLVKAFFPRLDLDLQRFLLPSV